MKLSAHIINMDDRILFHSMSRTITMSKKCLECIGQILLFIRLRYQTRTSVKNGHMKRKGLIFLVQGMSFPPAKKLGEDLYMFQLPVYLMESMPHIEKTIPFALLTNMAKRKLKLKKWFGLLIIMRFCVLIFFMDITVLTVLMD